MKRAFLLAALVSLLACSCRSSKGCGCPNGTGNYGAVMQESDCLLA